jgi:hypothetical protein
MTWNQIGDKSVEFNSGFGVKSKQGRGKILDRTAGQRRGMLKTFLGSGLMTLAVVSGGCMIVDSPIKGVLGTEVIWGDVAGKTAEADTLKQGKACAQSILGLLARGDASVRAAKENGGITEVSSVDHSARNLLNIVGEWCTLVRGK